MFFCIWCCVVGFGGSGVVAVVAGVASDGDFAPLKIVVWLDVAYPKSPTCF